MGADVLGLVAIALCSGGAAVLTFLFVRIPVLPRPKGGARALRRQRALESAGSFTLLEPLARFLAGRIARVGTSKQREGLNKRLLQGGDWLGLSADEFIALQIVGLAGGLGLGTLLAKVGDYGWEVVVVGAALGVLSPSITLDEATKDRFKRIDRSLPTAIDLAAMSMHAGLDFPGAVREVVNTSPDPQAPLTDELRTILRELELGRTRRDALRDFAERAPTDSVRDFVSAVVQAEEKGTPLSDVLSIQAEMSRMRRSVAAEEAAAKAGVKMMLPLMMIFGAVFLVLMGPMIIRVMDGGL